MNHSNLKTMEVSEHSARHLRTALPDRFEFRCRNGDGLQALNDQMAAIDASLNAARAAHRLAEEYLKPFKEEVERLESRKGNVGCRLNIWWNEFHGAGGKA